MITYLPDPDEIPYGLQADGSVCSSATRVQTFWGCLAKGYFGNVLGLREEKPYLSTGTRVHHWAETYLLGEQTAEQLITAAEAGQGEPLYVEALRRFVPGMALLPPPGKVDVERSWAKYFPTPNGGVWITGTPDYSGPLFRKHGLVGDHKTAKAFRSEKTEGARPDPSEARGYVDSPYYLTDLQIPVYGAVLYPADTTIIAEHVEYKTQGPPAARRIRGILPPGMAPRVLESVVSFVDTTVRRLYKMPVSKAPTDLEGNTGECWKYGGCEHRAYCPIFQRHNPGKIARLPIPTGV